MVYELYCILLRHLWFTKCATDIVKQEFILWSEALLFKMKKETTLSFCFVVKIGLIAVDSELLQKWVEWLLWRAAVYTVMELFQQWAGYMLGL
jgi:hypothetical protein